MTKYKLIFSVLFLFISFPAVASVADSALVHALRGIEFSMAGGPNWSRVDDTSLVVSPYETDNLMVNTVTKSALWKIGIGYHFFEDLFQQRRFLNDFLLELNVYRNAETVRGDVWQYQLPIFNNYHFTAPITSIRAMLDLKPGLFTLYHMTFYPILGVGAAWTTVSYREAVSGEGIDPNSYHSLGNKTNKNISYDLGTGFRVNMTEHLSATIEYLYNYLINLEPADESTTAAALSSPPTFTVYNQSLLLGLNWKI
jgi:opacity protein-like surface antigen